ncbi:MAG: hypothetical protein U9Q73_01940 [Nanoarchaeota archaeon]|nr:hypothetical protein [Nanoarchaeota archaeon]
MEEDPEVLAKQLKQALEKIEELSETIEELIPRGDIWNEIEDKWYEDRDILNRFKLLKRSIVDLKICHNTTCEVFKPISQLERKLDDIDYTNITQAKEKLGENSPKFIQFRKEGFEPLKDQLIELKKLIYQLHSVNIGKQDLINKAEKRRNTFLKNCGKYGIPYNAQVGADADAMSKLDEDTLMPNDPLLKKKHGIFDKKKQKVRE